MEIRNFTCSIWVTPEPENVIRVIDQRALPFEEKVFTLNTLEDSYFAIKEMIVRGAPLIGVTAAYGIYLALLNYRGKDQGSFLADSISYLNSSRPTAVNLSYATNRMLKAYSELRTINENLISLFQEAEKIRENEIESCRKIGEYGFSLIEEIYRQKGDTINILTHCNAGWLACVEWGTATAPIYLAHQKGIPLHIWVDETRPRNQGARLTAYELGKAGIDHTVIPDNTGGHLMQHGKVDMVIVGSDRTTRNGDVANKIGTYLKALAAFDNKIPFYVALPTSTIDWNISNGLNEIPIEERDGSEVSEIEGWNGTKTEKIRLIPEKSKVANFGFDITPARLITGLITEKGICKATREEIDGLFQLK